MFGICKESPWLQKRLNLVKLRKCFTKEFRRLCEVTSILGLTLSAIVETLYRTEHRILRFIKKDVLFFYCLLSLALM